MADTEPTTESPGAGEQEGAPQSEASEGVSATAAPEGVLDRDLHEVEDALEHGAERVEAFPHEIEARIRQIVREEIGSFLSALRDKHPVAEASQDPAWREVMRNLERVAKAAGYLVSKI